MALSFDATYYLNQRPDVFQAYVASAGKTGLTWEQFAQNHYNNNGRFEGSNPNATFNTLDYLTANPDVAKAGINPFTHYLTSGAAEGRAPSASFITFASFSSTYAASYLAANPDLGKAGITTAQQAYAHFVVFGEFENRPGAPAVTGNPGTTYTLTAATDNITGTINSDTVLGTVDAATAANSTLTAADRVNGGAGVDALTITTQGVAGANFDALNGALISNVETINLRATNTVNAANVDANSVVGLTAFNNTLSTAAVVVTNLADPAVVTVSGNGSVANGATTATYVAGALSGDLILAGGVTGGAIAVNGAGLTSLAIVSNGAANTTGAISSTGTEAAVTITAATALTTTGLTVGTLAAGGQTLTISGVAGNVAATATAAATGAVNLGTLDADFVTVNASGLTTGGISATLGSLTAAVTGGAGNDYITTAGVLTTGSVNAGAGTDRLIVATTADLGTAALGAKYTGFEHVQANDGVSVNLDNIAGITSVFLNDGAGATGFTNLSATQAGAITVLASNGASTIDVKDASVVGHIDTVGLIFDNGNTTLNETAVNSTFTLTGVENLKVTAIDAVNITASAATADVLSSVVFTGAGNITFVTGDMGAANFSLDASASTGVHTFNASAFTNGGLAITGGSGVDTITGSASHDIINGGAGNDVITGGAGHDVITGGAGNDTIIFANTAETQSGFAAANTSAANLDRITDFTGNGAAAGDTIQLGTGVNAFGAALTFATNTTAVVTAVTVATAADFTALTAAVQTASAGVASTTGAAGVAQVYDVTVTGGNLAGHYAIINDNVAAVAATDTIINITGSGALHQSDFTFV